MRGKPMNTTAELKRLEPLESAVEQLYRNRFPEEVLGRRNAVWKVLCRCWFSRYIPRDARVLEIGAGYCEFINHTAEAERVAIDLSPATRLHAAPEVTVHEVAAEDLTTAVPSAHFDVVFMSNFLEHCRSRDQLLAVLRAAATALKPRGHVLILGPNFRY